MLPERPQSVSLNGHAMRRTDLETMDFDELWLLHEQLTKLLSEKITTEKLQLERRLAQLSRVEQMGDVEGAPCQPSSAQISKSSTEILEPLPADAKVVWTRKAAQMACRRLELRTEVGRFCN